MLFESYLGKAQQINSISLFQAVSFPHAAYSFFFHLQIDALHKNISFMTQVLLFSEINVQLTSDSHFKQLL